MYDFLVIFSMHGYDCVFLVLVLSLEWVFLGVALFCSLALPFLDNHGVMGSHVFG